MVSPLIYHNGLICYFVVTSDSFATPYSVYNARLLCPLDFSGKNNEVSCRFIHLVIFLTQRRSLGLKSPVLQVDSLLLSHWGNQSGIILSNF